METNKSTEQELLEEYLSEANNLVSKRFRKDKTYPFTQKWINRLIQQGGQHDQFSEAELEEAKTMSAVEAREKILRGDVSYADFVRQLQEVKRRGGNENNHLTWSRFEEPLRRAQVIDEDIKVIGVEKAREKYPLLGFVMSVKESIYLKDTPSTWGLFINLDRVPTEDPRDIAALKRAGAVMTSKGNVPMLLFAIESINTIYGEAKHPLDPTRTVGGSSGGEGALLATGYNNAAIGSDIAGSLRIPALFNGICSLKPSWNRLTGGSHASAFERSFGSDRFPAQVSSLFKPQDIILPVNGPMARHPSDLGALMKVFLRNQKHDLHIPPLYWREDIQFRKRVGIIREFSFSKLCPAATRAMQEAENALIQKGYEIVELDVSDIIDEVIYWAMVAFTADDEINNIISGKTYIKEPLTDIFSLIQMVNSLPDFLLRLAKWKEGKSRTGWAIDCYFKAKKVSSETVRGFQSKLFGRFIDKMEEAGVDVILSPGMPIPAIKLYSSNECILMCCYMYAWNFLNLASGVMKITDVREGEDYFETDKEDEMAKSMEENAKGTVGLPVGISISARPFYEEIVVKVMEDIQAEIGA